MFKVDRRYRIAIVSFILITMVLLMCVPSFAAEKDGINQPDYVTVDSVAVNGYNSLKVSWFKAHAAQKYMVYRSETGADKEFKLVKTTSKLSYIDSNLACGKTYYYKICGVSSDNVKGYFSLAYSNRVRPAKVRLQVVSAREKDKNKENTFEIGMKWTAVKGASGYEVYRSEKNADIFTLVRTITKGKVVSYTDKLRPDIDYKGLPHAYKYKVRAYRTVSGTKVYGDFSSIEEFEPCFTVAELNQRFEYVCSHVKAVNKNGVTMGLTYKIGTVDDQFDAARLSDNSLMVQYFRDRKSICGMDMIIKDAVESKIKQLEANEGTFTVYMMAMTQNQGNYLIFYE